jgi:hypothetical protein
MDTINKDADDDYNIFNYGNIYIDKSGSSYKRDEIENKEEKKKNCFHNWKKYVGFTEVYYYCEYCDEKSNNDYDSSNKWYLK